MYTRYSSVSDMLDELGWPPLSQRRQEAQLILFYKIINGLAQVPFEGLLIEAYKGTRRKHNIQEAQLILFYKIINGLAQVPFEGLLIEAYKGTRRKHNMKFRQIGHTTSQYEQSFFPKLLVHGDGLAFAEALSLAVFKSNFL